MQDTINFIDLVALSRITPEATVERFGGLINSSFFDASNILGTLKQKEEFMFHSEPFNRCLGVISKGRQDKGGILAWSTPHYYKESNVYY